MNRCKKNQQKANLRRQQKAEHIKEAQEWAQKERTWRKANEGIVMCALIALICVLVLSWHWPRFRANFLIPPGDWMATTGKMQRMNMWYSSGRGGGWRVSGAYCYQIGNQRFTGSELGFNLRLDRAGLESLYNRLQPPTRVTVFYEKGNPEFSTLQLPDEEGKKGLATRIAVISLVTLLPLVGMALYIRSSLILRSQLQLRHIAQS